jgi:hypothetical protein
MAALVHSVAYTPPRMALKPAPKVWELVGPIKQPALVACPWALTSQLGVTRVPAEEELYLTREQPALVCNVMSLAVIEFTPSMISISPFVGQFGPTIQLE